LICINGRSGSLFIKIPPAAKPEEKSDKMKKEEQIMCKKLVSLVLVLALSPLAYAEECFVISDWEDDTLQGWTNGHNMPGGYRSGYPMWATDGIPTASGVLTPSNITPHATTDCQSPQGGTPGNLYSMTVQVPETWWDEAAVIDLTGVEGGVDAFFDNDTLRIVVSLKAADWPGIDASAWSRPGLTLAICAQTNDSRWDIDSVNYPGMGWWGSDDMPTWKTSAWLPSWGDYTMTFSFYYGDIITKNCKSPDYLLDVRDKIAANPSYLALIVIPHWGETFSGTAVGGTYEFDEATLVPEPATMALLGLGGLILIRRKR
jgi:hypothetical protein